MMLSTFCRLVTAAGCLLIGAAANAVPVSVSTGDLGNNVIDDAGFFAVSLNATTPSNVLASTIDVKYGLWNSPEVTVSVFFNGTLRGSFVADLGYVSPGPAFVSFDVTGLLLAGSNAISFDGFAANNGDYVVGQVTLNYDDSRTNGVPEPDSRVLLAVGLAGLGIARRRRKA